MGDKAQTSADFERAVDKIRDEMAVAKTNRDAIGAVGEIVTALLNANPAAAEAILQEGKTLAGCYKAMEDYARKHKDGNCYYMPPERAESVICGYFGIKPVDARTAGTSSVSASGAATFPNGGRLLGEGGETPPAQETKRQPAADPFDLDALMGVL